MLSLTVIGWIIAVLYAVAFGLSLLRLAMDRPRYGAIGLRVAVLASLIQAAAIAAHLWWRPAAALASFQEELQIAAFVLAVVFIGLCFSKRFYASGPFFLPFILLFCLISLTVPDYHFKNLFVHRGSGYLSLHLTSLFLTLAAFVVGLVTSILFLVEEGSIKHKRLSGIGLRLPPLAVIDDIHYRSLFVGFLLFSFTILTGAGYAKVTTGHYLTGGIKQFLSLLCWFFFAVLLNFRVQKGWQGHKGIVLSLIGFAGMTLLFIVGLS